MLPFRWSIPLIVACALLWPLYALALPPEVPGINCLNKRDDDRSSLHDVADPNCVAVANLVDVGDGYAVQGEHLLRTGDSEVTIDASADGGAYVGAIVGGRPYGDQRAAFGMAAGDYYLFLRVQILSPTAAEVFVKAGGEPFPIFRPDVRDGAALNNRQPTSGWTWLGPIGHYGSTEAAAIHFNATPQRTLTFAANDALWLVAPPGLLIDCVYLKPVASAEAPQCPAGGSTPEEPTLADFIAKEQGANVENADGSEDAYWGQAHSVLASAPGTDTGLAGTSRDVRLFWNDAATDRMCILGKTTRAGLISSSTANDQTATLSSTRVELGFRLADLTRVRDANTYKIACDSNGFVYDRNDAGGTSTPATDLANVDCGVSYVANALVIELCFDLPQAVAAGDLFLFDGALAEVTTAGSVAKTFFCTTGTNHLPDCWGTGELNATAMQVPADTTAPTVNSLVFSNVTASGFTLTAATNEGGTCSRGIDTVNDNTVADSLLIACGSSAGGECSCAVTGLTASTAYEAKVCVADPSGNRGCTAVGDQTTSAAAAVRYIKPAGSDAADGTSVPNAWKTWTYALNKARLTPGMTLMVENGTYTYAANGAFYADCTSSTGNAISGTSSAPITIRASNERQAFIQWSSAQAAAKFYPIRGVNCSYWRLEGLRAEGGDFEDSPENGHVVYFSDGGNNQFTRLLLRFNNRYKNGVIFSASGSNNLMQEIEAYSWHRNGMGAGPNATWRRNYFNSRAYADIPCTAPGCTSAMSTSRGDGALLMYPQSNTLWEDNISEGNSAGINIIGSAAAASRNNRLFGTISIGDQYGYLGTCKSTANGVHDTTIQDFLSLNSSHVAFYDRSVDATLLRNSTVVGNGSGAGISVDTNNSYPCDSVESFAAQDILVLGTFASYAFSIEYSGSNPIDTWSADGVLVEDSTSPYNPASAGNYSGKYQESSGVGTFKGCAPIGSRARDLGLGADVRYNYENGSKTANKRWVTTQPTNCPASSSGFYPYGAGACIAGVNDTATTSLYNVADRLSITTARLNACEADGTY